MTPSAAPPDIPTRQPREIQLADGTPVLLRPVLPEDKEYLQSGMARLSPDSRYWRFMAPLSRLSPEWLRYLTEIDYHNHFAIGALVINQTPPLGIAIARYVRDPNHPTVAEPAVTVVDDYQGHGLGSLLLGLLIDDAMAHGITRFRAFLLAENGAMKRLFLKQGAHFTNQGDGILSAEFALRKEEGEHPAS